MTPDEAMEEIKRIYHELDQTIRHFRVERLRLYEEAIQATAQRKIQAIEANIKAL